MGRLDQSAVCLEYLNARTLRGSDSDLACAAQLGMIVAMNAFAAHPLVPRCPSRARSLLLALRLLP